MSYARWSDGDVYVFGTGKGFVCMVCSLMPKEKCDGMLKGAMMNKDFQCKSEEEMLEHLKQHITAGDMVPNDAIERLKEEIKEKK